MKTKATTIGYIDGTHLVPFPSPEWASLNMPVDTLMGSNGTQLYLQLIDHMIYGYYRDNCYFSDIIYKRFLLSTILELHGLPDVEYFKG